MYPRLLIDRAKFRDNVSFIKKKLEQAGIDTVVVTKVFRAMPELMDILHEVGIRSVADSRIENLARIGPEFKKLLLRLPMLSEADRVVQYSDMALVSELEQVIALDRAAKRQQKAYGLILMIDLGDLREGVLVRDWPSFFPQLPKLKQAEWLGTGVNLTCYGGILPTVENLQQLIDAQKQWAEYLGQGLPLISGGNSSSLYLLDQQQMPPEINSLRIGEAIVLGRESAFGQDIPGMHRDVFRLEAELIEVKTKPSLPWGKLGLDAFGHVPTHQDQGPMRRGILAIGKQDIYDEYLQPRAAIKVIGASSDHTIVDLKQLPLKLGDIVSFDLTYGGLLQLMTSDYVHKVLI